MVLPPIGRSILKYSTIHKVPIKAQNLSISLKHNFFKRQKFLPSQAFLHKISYPSVRNVLFAQILILRKEQQFRVRVCDDLICEYLSWGDGDQGDLEKMSRFMCLMACRIFFSRLSNKDSATYSFIDRVFHFRGKLVSLGEQFFNSNIYLGSWLQCVSGLTST